MDSNGNKKSNCCRVCCCFFCCLFINVIIFGGVAVGVFFLWYQPKMPTFKFQSVNVDKLDVQLKDKMALITAQTTINVEIKNNNEKLAMYYGETGVGLTTANEETKLGYGEVGEFKQAVKDVTVLKFELKVDNEMIDESRAKELSEKMKNQEMAVDAMVKTKVGFGVGQLKIGMVPVTVNCRGVPMKQTNAANSSPQCSLTAWRWNVAHSG